MAKKTIKSKAKSKPISPKPKKKADSKPKPLPVSRLPKQEKPEVKDFTEIGGSPVPGLTLRHVLRGHTGHINRIAWSPDGKYLASPSEDKTIRIWDGSKGECVRVLEGHTSQVYSVAWSPDSQHLVSGSQDQTIFLWAVKSEKSVKTKDMSGGVYSVDWSPDGRKLMLGEAGKVSVWDAKDFNMLVTLDKHDAFYSKITCSPDSSIFCSCEQEHGYIDLYNLNDKSHLALVGHKKYVNCVLWAPKGNYIASASGDHTIGIWQPNTGKRLYTLESHIEEVECVTFSYDGSFLASLSKEKFVVWRTDTWQEILQVMLDTRDNSNPLMSIAFHPQLPILATLGEKDRIIRIWELDEAVLLGQGKENVNYTTAKLVLVGDSGVGKTGLGWRLAHGEFKVHPSTHGQQFWVVDKLGTKRQDGAECEAILWDVAGQHIYRSIHSIFLDHVDASLILFDASNRQDPLKGVEFWLSQLAGKKKLPPSILVGARSDVSPTNLSQADLDQFCQKYGISGGYISTSAKSGEGIPDLLEKIKSQISWDAMTATVTTVTFKRIKDYVLSLKEKTDRKGVLVSPAQLREQLESIDKDWQFSDAEMMTAVGHLENHGYVSVLQNSSGEIYILLVPELLASTASSIVMLADKNSRELGAVSETELLQGRFEFEELKGLDKKEQQILIDAAILRFLEHSICFRERNNDDVLLIFPSLIKQKRPLEDEFEFGDDVSYIVRGRVENLYAALVVLLGYTSIFTRRDQWQNQAQYNMGMGEVCGFRLKEEREGELELILYYSVEMPTYGRTMFQGLFESFVYKRDVEVTSIPPVLCPNKHRIERATVIKRVREGKNFAFCDECGEKTFLPEIEKPQILGGKQSRQIQREESLAKLRGLYETKLTRIKSFRSDRAAPRCYISHVDSDQVWVDTLIHDLRDAGVLILEGKSLLKENDFILQVCTPEYKDAWDKSTGQPGEVAHLILPRLTKPQPTVIPIRRNGKAHISIPKELLGCMMANFHMDTYYSVSLFDLVMSLYAIPLNHEAFKPLRKALHSQWEQTLENIIESKQEIFISYAWGEDREAIVNELDEAFQSRGVTIIRDKRDLGFKGSIKGFMDSIGEGKAVVLVISEKYLKSPNCCFELVQIAKHGQFKDRIFPIVLNDANIYNPAERVRYVKHWEEKKTELDDLMKDVSAANMDGFREDIDLYTEIRTLLPKLMDVIKDMNTLSSDLHRQSGFSEIFDAVMAKLEE